MTPLLSPLTEMKNDKQTINNFITLFLTCRWQRCHMVPMWSDIQLVLLRPHLQLRMGVQDGEGGFGGREGWDPRVLSFLPLASKAWSHVLPLIPKLKDGSMAFPWITGAAELCKAAHQGFDVSSIQFQWKTWHKTHTFHLCCVCKTGIGCI